MATFGLDELRDGLLGPWPSGWVLRRIAVLDGGGGDVQQIGDTLWVSSFATDEVQRVSLGELLPSAMAYAVLAESLAPRRSTRNFSRRSWCVLAVRRRASVQAREGCQSPSRRRTTDSAIVARVLTCAALRPSNRSRWTSSTCAGAASSIAIRPAGVIAT